MNLLRCASLGALLLLASHASAQLTDITQTPNAANAGIKKSMLDEVGMGRGASTLPGSSLYLIQRDPFRAIARGRQLFQRKFTMQQGLGPRTNDGVGDIETDGSHGAGLSDSCASCHGRPFGSAGAGGNVFTRPGSRDAPHLFGLGLQEMLGDEITHDLRAIRESAIDAAVQAGVPASLPLVSKGIRYGFITGLPSGMVDTSGVEGVNPDLRVRPFFAQGGTISIREFLVGALNAEMGLESPDPDLLAAAAGADVVTPSGMVLSGSLDKIEGPPASSRSDDADHDGVVNEIPTSLVDFLEFYLLNYFRPGVDRVTPEVVDGYVTFNAIGCATCHIPILTIESDRRVADTVTLYNPPRANVVYNQLFAAAATQHSVVDDGLGLPPLKHPAGNSFVVGGIFADFKRHDLGPNFYERNFDGSVQTEFMTEPLWGVGSTAPYGHDGRSNSLHEVILRHGGEADTAKLNFVHLTGPEKENVIALLRALVLFSPPDTSSNLDPANPMHPDFPMAKAGSIDLSVLFNDGFEKE